MAFLRFRLIVVSRFRFVHHAPMANQMLPSYSARKASIVVDRAEPIHRQRWIDLATSRIITTMLFGITPMDTQAYGGVLLVAIPLVILAAIIPGIKAARVDPMIALREP